jgi:hypothetical protein
VKNSNRQRWRGHTPLLAAGCASAILIMELNLTKPEALNLTSFGAMN